jgi:5'-methylthioadenosine nucleosidase
MTKANAFKNIVILMAMQEEASPIIDAFKLSENKKIIPNLLPFKCYQSTTSSNLKNIRLTLLTSGMDTRYQVDNIGCEAATLMAYQAISLFNPELLISAGTAGGFEALGAEIGTTYIGDQYFIFHDRIVPLAGFEQSAIGKFPAADMRAMATELGLKTGIISTGSSLQKNTQDKTIIESHAAVAKEMEAAAIAWVAMLYKVPMTAIKSITNLVDLDNQSEHEFVKNFDVAVNALRDNMLRVINYLAK